MKSIMKSPLIIFTAVLVLITNSLFFNFSYADDKNAESKDSDNNVGNKAKKPHNELITAGWLEGVFLLPSNLQMRAKLDTGAKTSSLHAVDIEPFKRDGKKWIKFRTGDYGKKAKFVTMEVPLARYVRIKDHKRKSARRPVVDITFCFDEQLFTTEFSLVDRSRFNYPVLLGRKMLQQGIIVDPSLTHTFRPDKKACGKLIQASQKQLAD